MNTPRSFPAVWDSTILSDLRACARKFELSHIFNYKPKGTNVHLHAGACFARGLEVTRRAYYAENLAPEDSVALGVAALITAWGDFDPGPDAKKTLDRVCGALEFYFSEYPLPSDPARVIMVKSQPVVEFSFAIPLPIKHPDTDEPLIFAGRFDAAVEFAAGLYAMDEKTTSSLGATWSRQWDLRGQFCGYAYAMREYGLRPAGTIVSGVSILKTKYEQQRAIIAQPDWKIDEWLADSLEEVQLAKDRYLTQGARWRKNWSESCNDYGGCTYKSVCSVPDPTPWLETYYEIRPWNPLEKH